ncbi:MULTISPECIES: DedA family protein [Candidatus Ichthyocystis]|uniref:DedA family protein n=1 Tax=Candidatus Ichthyocystis TaxID=2929841 RepID=UPI00158479C9|nr:MULTISPECIES: DedA family protein [Ichthyocystis]
MFHLDLLLNAESLLSWLLRERPNSVYFALFVTFFLESGVFFMPFLPGDSLLLIAGMVLPRGELHIEYLLTAVVLGASLGNIFGYMTGFLLRKWLGFEETLALGFFDKKLLVRVQNFFTVYGSFSVLLVRFMPFFRTFFPFLAGVFRTPIYSFSAFSFLGSVIWGCFFVFVGKFLGKWSFIQEFLGILTIFVILLSAFSFFLWLYKRRK